VTSLLFKMYYILVLDSFCRRIVSDLHIAISMLKKIYMFIFIVEACLDITLWSLMLLPVSLTSELSF
jgi:hypothetical protein